MREGGLKVYTTLDRNLQAAAQQAIADQHTTPGASAALVSTDTETGEILAMASSEAYEDSQFNLAAQGLRQPGSAFKPFVLTTAVDQGIDPDSTFYAAPSTITLTPDAYTSLDRERRRQRHDEPARRDRELGQHRLRAARRSTSARRTSPRWRRRWGSPPSSAAIRPRRSAASPRASRCSRCRTPTRRSPTAASTTTRPRSSKVEFPDGEVDEPEDPEGERVITDGVAYEVADVMKGTLEYGTAAGLGIGCPASGKTGTTEEQSDAWFVGYTPHVSTAVWVGNPDARVPMPGYGADLAAPIWQQYMNTAATSPCDDFPAPENPAELSGFYSGNTASSGSEYDYDYDSDDATDDTTDTDTDADTGAPTDETDPNYDPDLYAPGAGQEPLPPPDPPAGGGDTGGGGGGGPASGGTGA